MYFMNYRAFSAQRAMRDDKIVFLESATRSRGDVAQDGAIATRCKAGTEYSFSHTLQSTNAQMSILIVA
jgi:hypothetical protein